MLERRAQRKCSPYIFPGQENAKGKVGLPSSGRPCRAIARLIDKQGLNDAAMIEAFRRAAIYSLRHSYASWLRQQGLALE